ncbi:hypothetical protein TREMEDRAFT_41027 [Tremella mesenterica DSM 1558]|uniref:uncharacterized protein n=1 Tax=Tremella mesenterica (strain ATCC 24925 / CBS 8224 / DSM 1558 / NBRC 9311 / NRRL Y-6157 / RJB 2259-6 / UBC 559-6) TaxID=578456 RepID=UPI00032CB56D|nr:uncharacterized protein TREMEDRAFT_41027 [Tremella mesenterica DSM 1558]EIW66416.1 hypothetical protein TREMEDRAFT_41027 [Tremella mesenterica DSM 1558]
MTPSTDSESQCTSLHAIYCFDVLVAHHGKRQPMPPPFDNADVSFALFVTWDTTSRLRSDNKPSLRGCIGTFSPYPLSKGLKEYALIAALQDHRFSPIKKSEMSSLICGVSLLTPFIPISDPLDWTPGIHGIHITFPDPSSSNSSSHSTPHPTSPNESTHEKPHRHRRTLSATYLPEVCLDQGWTREECILSAIQKAGWRGKVRVGDDVWNSLQVQVYESVKAKCTWEEYVEYVEARKS